MNASTSESDVDSIIARITRGISFVHARATAASAPSRAETGARTGYPSGKPSSLSVAEGRYRLVAIVVIVLGVTMSGVDTSAVILGLPIIGQELRSSLTSMIWVLTGYLLIITVSSTQVGKLGDMFGRVRMYNFGFGLFTLGSLLCGLSVSGSQLIGFRLIQGLGGAFIYSNSGAIIADTFPPNERGRAYGITGSGYSLGAILGILVGGAFVTFLSWRYIFFINLPIGLIGTVVVYLTLKERSPKIKVRFDIAGMALFGIAITLLLLATTGITGSGLTFEYLLELAAGIICIVSFIALERRSASPLLKLSLLRQRVLAASILAALFQALASFSVLFLVIMYLQGPRGMSPWNASVLLIPGYIIGGSVAPFSGRLSDKLGARVVASAGLSLQVLGFLVYASLGLTTPLYMVIAGSILSGIGNGTFFPANNSAVMASAPSGAYGVVAGLLRTFANVGQASSFAIALLIASLSIPRQQALDIFLGIGRIQGSLSAAYVSGMHYALFGSILVLFIAFGLSILRGRDIWRSISV